MALFTTAALIGGGLAAKYLGSKKGEISQEAFLTPEQKAAQTRLNDFGKKFEGSFTPGKEFDQLDFLTSTTGLEDIGLNQLGSFLNSPSPQVVNSAADLIQSTLTGSDPLDSDLYKSARRRIEDERKDLMAQTKNRLSASGNTSSSSREQFLDNVNTQSFNSVADLIASVTERERERRLGAVLPALQVASTQEALPLQRISASQQFGGLPRNVAQLLYSDFLRKQQEAQVPLQVDQNLLGQRHQFGIPSVKTSSQNALGDIGDLALSFGTKGLSSFFKPQLDSAVSGVK